MADAEAVVAQEGTGGPAEPCDHPAPGPARAAVAVDGRLLQGAGMDAESPEHLERLRQQPEVKAALLLRGPQAGADQCRFERAAKNTLYWPAIEELALRMRAGHGGQAVREDRTFYGRPCWLLVTCLSPAADGPFTIAVVAADGEPTAVLEDLLQRVSRDYWFGSRFFK